MFPNSITRNGKRIKNYKPQLIRSADDFVVIHKELEIIWQYKAAIQEWLKPIGLELKEEKTKICHTLNRIEINGIEEKPGFDFLDFNIKQYPVEKHHSGKTQHGELLGFKTLIKPSNKAVKAHKAEIKSIVKAHKTAPQESLIKHLNPSIRGWCNYSKGYVPRKHLVA